MLPTDSENSASSDIDEDRKSSDKPLRKDRSGALIGLFILAIIYTAYFASPILIPMVLAILLSLILTPPVRWLVRLHIPYALGAAIVLVILLIGFGAAIYGLSGPAMHWVKEAPRAVKQLEHTLRHTNGPLENVQKSAQKINDIANDNPRPGGQPKSMKVVDQHGGVIERFFSVAPGILSKFGITIVLLYFLLAAGDTFLRSLVSITPQLSEKKACC